MVYPALLPLLPLMRTPLLPVVEWTDAPADLNGLVRFAERRNLFSARVPSHFKSSLIIVRTSMNIRWKSTSTFFVFFKGLVCFIYRYIKKGKVKCFRYRPGVARRVGRGIALLLHDRGTRRGWVVSSTPRPHFTPGKDPIPILQEDGWTPGPVWTDGKTRPHRDSIPDRPARSQSLYRLSYRPTYRYITAAQTSETLPELPSTTSRTQTKKIVLSSEHTQCRVALKS